MSASWPSLWRSNYYMYVVLRQQTGGAVGRHSNSISPKKVGRQKYWKILRLASVDMHFKDHIQIFLLSILQKLLIVGSSAPASHLVFGILRFRTYIWHFIKAFWKILLHDFDVGLLTRDCYPTRSYSPLSNFYLTF